MNHRLIGIFIFVLALAMAVIMVLFNTQIDQLINQQMAASGGSCFDELGNCLHEKNQMPVYLGIIIVLLTFTLAVYVFFFGEEKPDKSNKEHDPYSETWRLRVDRDANFQSFCEKR